MLPFPAIRIIVNPGSAVNRAVRARDVSALAVVAHVLAVALSQPLQPTNADPGAGVAVSATASPTLAKNPSSPGHEAGQSIPAGLLVTAPVPVPAFLSDTTGPSKNALTNTWKPGGIVVRHVFPMVLSHP
jgi:hypothetical protein